MVPKFHKTNTNFQIAHFLAGSCHTLDGAYFLLRELKESREDAIRNASVVKKRQDAAKLRAEAYLASNKGDEAGKLEAQADLEEIKNHEDEGKILYEAALDELAFIEHCIKILNEIRPHKDLPDLLAHEAMQKEEWKYELIRRAENHMLTTGTISPDEIATMRMHPAFKTDILPRIKEMQDMLMLPNGSRNPEGLTLLEKSLGDSKVEEWKLLENKLK